MAKKNVTDHKEETVGSVFDRIAAAFQAFTASVTDDPEDEMESLKEEREALEKFYATRKDEINTELKRLEERENMRKIAETLKNERDGLIDGGISEEEANYIMNSRLEEMLINRKEDRGSRISYIPVQSIPHSNYFSINTATSTSFN